MYNQIQKPLFWDDGAGRRFVLGSVLELEPSWLQQQRVNTIIRCVGRYAGKAIIAYIVTMMLFDVSHRAQSLLQ